MRRIISSYAPVIRKIETLDPVGIDGIHVTLQGIGFTDEVSMADIRKIVTSVSSRCAQLEPIRVGFDEPRIDEEALHMNLHPVERLARVKRALRDGIGDV